MGSQELGERNTGMAQGCEVLERCIGRKRRKGDGRPSQSQASSTRPPLVFSPPEQCSFSITRPNTRTCSKKKTQPSIRTKKSGTTTTSRTPKAMFSASNEALQLEDSAGRRCMKHCNWKTVLEDSAGRRRWKTVLEDSVGSDSAATN